MFFSKYVLQRNEEFSAVMHSRSKKKFMAINWSLYPSYISHTHTHTHTLQCAI